MLIEQLQRSQLQIVEVERRLAALFFVELPLNCLDDLDQFDGISSRVQIEKRSRDAPSELVLPDQFIKPFNQIFNLSLRSRTGRVAESLNGFAELRRRGGFGRRAKEVSKLRPTLPSLPPFLFRRSR